MVSSQLRGVIHRLRLNPSTYKAGPSLNTGRGTWLRAVFPEDTDTVLAGRVRVSLYDLRTFGNIRGRKQDETDLGPGSEYWISAGVPYNIVANICVLGAA